MRVKQKHSWKKDVSYMKPMIEQVLAEKQEKADWDSGRIYWS